MARGRSRSQPAAAKTGRRQPGDGGRLPRRPRWVATEAPGPAPPDVAGARADWADLAKRRLKGELARANVRYAELAERLTRMGVPETRGSLQVKISRGAFSAWFLLAALRALGADSLRLE